MQEDRASAAWYQKASRVLDSAVADNAANREANEVPPDAETVAAASEFLRALSSQLSAVAAPKVSISEKGAITFRWKVSEGRIDVSCVGNTLQAFVSVGSEHKAIPLDEVPGRVVALLAV